LDSQTRQERKVGYTSRKNTHSMTVTCAWPCRYTARPCVYNVAASATIF